jgi:AcrR family transcriptional regulator
VGGRVGHVEAGASRPSAGDDTRGRLVAATLRCVEARGLQATTVEDVAREAGMSRATVYRHVPGGRAQLVADAVATEAGRFLERLREAMDEVDDPVASLRAGLVLGHRAIHDHALLQQVLRTEPGELLAELAASEPLLHGVVAERVRAVLEGRPLAPGVVLGEATDYVTSLFLSYLGSQGRWDLADEAAVDRLVRVQLLGGVLARRGG